MDYATILLLVAAVAVGVVSAVVRTWAIHARLYSLEDRLSVVEGVTTREVKIRAAQSRPPRYDRDEAALKELSNLRPESAKYTGPWWKNPALKQGGFP
jgi:hypothetical protein